jgi:GGDEF domain-containing protein
MFGLEGLEHCGDARGKDKGGEALVRFGMILREYTAGGDILARVGDGKFMVIIKKMLMVDGALKKGEEICAAFGDWAAGEGKNASCAAGLAVMGQGDSITEVAERANRALGRTKKRGEGSCCLWEEWMV